MNNLQTINFVGLDNAKSKAKNRKKQLLISLICGVTSAGTLVILLGGVQWIF